MKFDTPLVLQQAVDVLKRRSFRNIDSSSEALQIAERLIEDGTQRRRDIAGRVVCRNDDSDERRFRLSTSLFRSWRSRWRHCL